MVKHEVQLNDNQVHILTDGKPEMLSDVLMKLIECELRRVSDKNGFSSVEGFIKDKLTPTSKFGVRLCLASTLYEMYLNYCYDNFSNPLGRNSFYNDLRKNGAMLRISSGNTLNVYNYQFKEDFDDDDEEW